MTAPTVPSSRVRRTRRPVGLLAAVALAGLTLTSCSDGGDEYEPLPPTPDYAAPGAGFCSQLMQQLVVGDRGEDWKLADWRAATEEETAEPAPSVTPSATASASPTTSSTSTPDAEVLENIENGVCAFEVTRGDGAGSTRSMVALSVIVGDDAGVRGLYEHASSQTAAVMELNYDARPADVPGEWTQSLRAELVPPARGKVPVDLQDLVLSGNLHANLKAHAGGVAPADVADTQAELRWASEQVLQAVTALLAEDAATD